MESSPRIVLYYQTVEGIKPIFAWLNTLNDAKGKVAVFERLKRAQRGTLGHCDDLGGGVWGFKIDVGPGYRVYFGQDGPVVIILLCGGKSMGRIGMPKGQGPTGRTIKPGSRREENDEKAKTSSRWGNA